MKNDINRYIIRVYESGVDFNLKKSKLSQDLS